MPVIHAIISVNIFLDQDFAYQSVGFLCDLTLSEELFS